MQKITTSQMKKMHVLLNKLGLMDEKVTLVYQASKGRATSSKDLTISEARSIIEHLNKYAPDENKNEKMKKKVFAIAYEVGIIYGHTPEDMKMNAAKIDMFLKDRGAIKKPFNQLDRIELLKVVKQFEQMRKHKEESMANKVTRSLLSELGINQHAKCI